MTNMTTPPRGGLLPRVILYNLVLGAGILLASPWVLYQFLFVPRRRKGLGQRLGAAPVSEGPTVWCHAVSVGEVRAVEPMLRLLEEDGRTTGRVVLSTVTPTGQETARRECGFVRDIFYFPLDLPFAVGRALKRVNPEIFVTAETELWPNFLAACFRRKIPVVVVNGRISDGSFEKYLRFRWFFRPFVAGVTLFLMQSDEDARRILGMGARPESVRVTGNTKYDRRPAGADLPRTARAWGGEAFLLVAGSTHAGEEETIIEALSEPGLEEVRCALVPRHPERFDEVERILKTRGCDYVRFSSLDEGGAPPETRFMLVDAMGVLDGFYALADVAFVGGSLVPVGGHNLLEPAMHGVPVLTGPHLHNFREMARELTVSGCLSIVSGPTEMMDRLGFWLRDETARSTVTEAAKNVSGTMVGASTDNAGRVLRLLDTEGGEGSVRRFSTLEKDA